MGATVYNETTISPMYTLWACNISFSVFFGHDKSDSGISFVIQGHIGDKIQDVTTKNSEN